MRREHCIMRLSAGQSEVLYLLIDRKEFLHRMGTLAKGSSTDICAYALMTNHLHLREILD